MCEKLNQTITVCISKYSNANRTNWDELLPRAVHVYNGTTHKTTGYSPFEVIYGLQKRLPIDNLLDRPDSRKYGLDEIKTVREEVRRRIQEGHETSKERYDRRVKETEFQVGDEVLIAPSPLHPKISKLSPRHYNGPFRIVARTSQVNYMLQDEEIEETEPFVIHIDRLKKYHRRNSDELTSADEMKNNTIPKTVIDDDNDQNDHFQMKTIRNDLIRLLGDEDYLMSDEESNSEESSHESQQTENSDEEYEEFDDEMEKVIDEEMEEEMIDDTTSWTYQQGADQMDSVVEIKDEPDVQRIDPPSSENAPVTTPQERQPMGLFDSIFHRSVSSLFNPLNLPSRSPPGGAPAVKEVPQEVAEQEQLIPGLPPPPALSVIPTTSVGQAASTSVSSVSVPSSSQSRTNEVPSQHSRTNSHSSQVATGPQSCRGSAQIPKPAKTTTKAATTSKATPGKSKTPKTSASRPKVSAESLLRKSTRKKAPTSRLNIADTNAKSYR